MQTACSSGLICALPVKGATLKTKASIVATQGLAKALASTPKRKYLLRLFVAGAADRSRDAIKRVNQLCKAEPRGSCQLDVIDIYQEPKLARDNQIIATPTLVREFPLPARRFIGSLLKTPGLFGEPDLGPTGDAAP